jgi:hypothetical protein
MPELWRTELQTTLKVVEPPKFVATWMLPPAAVRRSRPPKSTWYTSVSERVVCAPSPPELQTHGLHKAMASYEAAFGLQAQAGPVCAKAFPVRGERSK